MQISSSECEEEEEEEKNLMKSRNFCVLQIIWGTNEFIFLRRMETKEEFPFQ